MSDWDKILNWDDWTNSKASGGAEPQDWQLIRAINHCQRERTTVGATGHKFISFDDLLFAIDETMVGYSRDYGVEVGPDGKMVPIKKTTPITTMTPELEARAISFFGSVGLAAVVTDGMVTQYNTDGTTFQIANATIPKQFEIYPK